MPKQAGSGPTGADARCASGISYDGLKLFRPWTLPLAVGGTALIVFVFGGSELLASLRILPTAYWTGRVQVWTLLSGYALLALAFLLNADRLFVAEGARRNGRCETCPRCGQAAVPFAQPCASCGDATLRRRELGHFAFVMGGIATAITAILLIYAGVKPGKALAAGLAVGLLVSLAVLRVVARASRS